MLIRLSGCCQLSFSVIYRQSASSADRNMAIAVGVLSAVAILHALLLTISWYRRSGRLVVDLTVLIKFLLFALGTVADAIFVVLLGYALYQLLLYKVRIASVVCRIV